MALALWGLQPTRTAWAAGSLTGGTLTFSDFAASPLTGTQHMTSATWSIANIADTRGTGAGWNLSLTLTPLREYSTGSSSYVPGGKALAAASVAVTQSPTVSLVDQTSSPTTTLTLIAAGTVLDTGAPVTLISAALGGGMGTYAFSALAVTLTVPASAYATTYRADATVTLTTGP